MAGTISMAGLGSGMDVAGMVDALVTASSAPMNVLKTRAKENRAASTAISDVASLLAKLKSSVDVLADPSKIQSYAVSSSDSAVQASISGAASESKFSLEVHDLALEYRAYSDSQDSLTNQLSLSGDMNIQIGTGDPHVIAIESTDSLNSIVSKINDANIGVKATTVYDGSRYRLQLRGTATGAGNEVTVSGIDMGLNAVGNLKQQAQSAHVTIDGIDVYSKTNQISGAIPGVSISVSKETTSPVTVEVKPDASTLKTKIQSVVDSYNAVIKKVQTLAGYGTTKASNEQLAGDSILRQLTMKMSGSIGNAVDTGTAYSTMRSIGISLNRDGTLSLDESTLTKAVSANPESVSKILAGNASSAGIMDNMSDLVKTFTIGSNALLNSRRDSFDRNAKSMEDRATAEQERLERLRETLNKQFSAMDSSVSSSNSTLTYLQSLSSSS
jgi:flagellar hook-associated protein 2